MIRIFSWAFAAAPALVLVLLAWLYLHVGLAAIFTAVCSAAAGYTARWIDEGIAREERIRKWTGPI